jgi:hypothetical protein
VVAGVFVQLLSAGLNVGISKMSAVGEVYDLKKVS